MFNSVYMYERVHRQNSEISERYLYQNKVYRYRKYFELPLVFVTISKIASPTILKKQKNYSQIHFLNTYILHAFVQTEIKYYVNTLDQKSVYNIYFW